MCPAAYFSTCVSVAALKYSSVPYVWIFLALSAVLVFTAWVDSARRVLWINVASVNLGLGLFEYYLWTSRPQTLAAFHEDQGTFSEDIFVPQKELGWAPKPGTAATHTRFFQGERLYDVTYTIGPNGLRISSPSQDHAASTEGECALLFGGSFTFGQGLEDDESLPFQVYEISNGEYRTYNFGVMGYGAHQMLSALQHGLVDDATRCKKTQVSHVFYQAISDHIRRAAGRLWWNTHGPRYRRTQDGSIRLDGYLEDEPEDQNQASFIGFLGTQIFKSIVYRSIVEGKYVSKFKDETMDLYLGIVDEARKYVRSNYPCAEFHVLLWDEDDIDNRAMQDGLRERGIDLHLMSDILPHYQIDALNETYRLHHSDDHPNALANSLIAEHVVRKILPQPTRCDPAAQLS
jgi:hypothetical protein